MGARVSPRRVGWKKWALVASGTLLGWIQLRVYFVRELLVAELLFLLAFGLVGILCGVCLLLGTIGECGGLLIREGTQTLVRNSSADPFDPRDAQEHNRTAIPTFSD